MNKGLLNRDCREIEIMDELHFPFFLFSKAHFEELAFISFFFLSQDHNLRHNLAPVTLTPCFCLFELVFCMSLH